MVEHHPAPELLAAYSAGSLPLSHALSIGAHVEYCSICQTNLQRLNNLGAQIFETQARSPIPDDLRSSVLDALDENDPHEECETCAEPKYDKSIPRCLHQFIPEGYDALNWTRISSSIETAKLCTDKHGARVEMVRIKPGGRIATHTHTGDEFTVVLEGSFSDESGIYRTGDFVLKDSSHKHKPMATKDARCICLTVTDAPIAFTGFFTRWLNPLVRKGHLTAF